MCDIYNERIRINQILYATLRQINVLSFDRIVHCCIAALQDYYDDPFLAESIEAKVRNFALLYLATCRRGELASPDLRPLPKAA